MSKSKIKSLIPYLFIVIFVFLLILPQIYYHFFLSGMDYYFHMSRTYETAMQIKTGHLSYFLSLFSWQRNARILNAMYGPLGGYVSGFLLLITKTWLRWEIAFNSIVLLIAGISMHQLNHYWHLNPIVDLLVTLLYMISPPVFNFIFFQSFYSVGAAFLPLVFLMGSKITNNHFSSVKLTFIMIILAELHILTTALAIIVLAFFIIPTLVMRSDRIKILLKLSLAVIMTIVLTFNVWGALLEVSISNQKHMLLTYPNTQKLNGNPFNTIINQFPRVSIWRSPSIIGPFILLIAVLAIIFWFVNIKHTNLAFTIIFIIGIVFMTAASSIFPWDYIQLKAPVIDTVIQFPIRFLSVGLIAMYLVFGKLVSNHHKYILIPGIVILLLAIMNVGYTNYRTIMARGRHFYTSAVIDWRNMHWNHKHTDDQIRQDLLSHYPNRFIDILEKPVPDYLPTHATYTDQNPYKYIKLQPYTHTRIQLLFHHYHTLKYHISLHHRAEEVINVNSDKKQKIRLPFVKYQHTVVTLNGHRINPTISNVGAIYIPLKAGKNRVTLYYQPNLIYCVGIKISIIVLIITILAGLGLILMNHVPWFTHKINY